MEWGCTAKELKRRMSVRDLAQLQARLRQKEAQRKRDKRTPPGGKPGNYKRKKR